MLHFRVGIVPDRLSASEREIHESLPIPTLKGTQCHFVVMMVHLLLLHVVLFYLFYFKNVVVCF